MPIYFNRFPGRQKPYKRIGIRFTALEQSIITTGANQLGGPYYGSAISPQIVNASCCCISCRAECIPDWCTCCNSASNKAFNK